MSSNESRRRLIEKLRRELGSLICAMLDDPEVVEIMLNPDGQIWVERLGKEMEWCGSMDADAAENLISTVAASLRRTVTRESSILECELPDGSRFEAVLPPNASAPTFTIRRRASKVFTLADYERQGVMKGAEREALEQAVEDHRNILVVGGTGSGKTTLANALIAQIAQAYPQERLVVLEDTPEIQCSSKNSVTLRTSASADLTELLRVTMRLRPDRILVGEVRDGAALGLLKAWNTGHLGGISTIHANNAYAGLIRLEQLIAEVTPSPMQALIAEAVGLIVVIRRTAEGRRIEEMVSVEGFDAGRYVLEPVKE